MTKNIALVITGSVATIRTVKDGAKTGLVEELQKDGFNVTIIATQSAIKYGFADIRKLEQITGNKVYTTRNFEEAIKNADMIMVSPSAAGFISQIANTTTEIGEVLAHSDKPKLISPAMNPRMWEHPATQRNIRQLVNLGWNVAGPVSGEVACGEFGNGRMLNVVKIAEAAKAVFAGEHSELLDIYKQALVTNAKLPLEFSAEAAVNKKILLVVQGGRDAMSINEVISALKQKGCDVTCAVSHEALEVANVEQIQRLTGNEVLKAHYQTDKKGMEHINISRGVDIVVIAPVTKRYAQEMAIGGATGFVSDIYLAVDKPVVIIPSIDPNHRPAAADIERLKQDGAILIPRTNSNEIASQVTALLKAQKQI